MAEMSNPGEHHRQPQPVRRVKHFLIAHRAAGLNDGGRGLDAVGLFRPINEHEAGYSGEFRDVVRR